MGSLRKFDISRTGCNYFVETGTGMGRSLRHAYLCGGFERLYSIEAFPETAQRAKARFRGVGNISIVNSDSERGLRSVLREIGDSGKVFFFLDAHFVGELSSSYAGYASNEVNDINLPLERELRLIRELRPQGRDVILVDDLRIYENGPFENGNLPEGFANIPESDRDLCFLNDVFQGFEFRRDYRDEGYLLVLPQSASFDLKALGRAGRLIRDIRELGLKIRSAIL